MSPVGAIFVPFTPKTGTNMIHPRPPAIVELVVSAQYNGGLLDIILLTPCDMFPPKSFD